MRVNSKGFTLIELLMTLGLLGVVMIIIYSFFFTNLTTYEYAEDEIELQQNTQFTIEFLNRKLSEGKSILKAWDKNRLEISDITNKENTVKAFIIKTKENEYIFKILDTEDSGILKYGPVKKMSANLSEVEGQANMEISRYIDKIKIKGNESLENKINGLTIKLYPKKGNYSLSPIETTIYFRNHN